jgi:CrcB protein
MTTALAIVAGGAGAAVRYLVGVAAQRRWPERPVGTGIVNVLGAGALGMLIGADAAIVRVVGAGFLGGFTTYSTWMVDTWAIAGRSSSHRFEAALNIVLVLGGGIAAFAVAAALT